MAPAKDSHRWVGNHPQDFFGQMIEPGGFITLTKEQLDDAHVKDYLEQGSLISTSEKGES